MTQNSLSLVARLLILLLPMLALAGDRHQGVASCASSLCHGSSKPLEAHAVLQNEYVTWSQFDPHSGAYRVLLEPRSREIARRMGLGKPEEAPACLGCHAELVPAAQRGPRFQPTDGIGCEACHGAAERWLPTHHQSPAVTHADNLLRGLLALERPEVRAEKCTACHVGDADRFANHRMMAAGHPRLVFELDTYTELWRSSGGREHYRRDTDYLQRKAVPPSASVWVTGLGAATRQQLVLLAQHAEKPRGPFPDFALYACHSCHRDLKLDAWGSASSGEPGALRLQDGQARTLQVVATALGLPSATAFSTALDDLQAAVNDERSRLPPALAAARRLLSSIETEARGHRWTNADRDRVLAKLVTAAERGSFADPAAAEQAAMGMVVLLADLNLERSRRTDIERLFAALRDDNAFDAQRFQRALHRLSVR